jgi:hypothetical protein
MESISVRMDFSSTEDRVIAPLGRGVGFVLGNGCGGSAGSFIAAERGEAERSWAEVEIAKINNREKHETRTRNLVIFVPEDSRREV